MRALTRLLLDDGNGGIIRDLSHEGLSFQAVTPLRVGQQVTLRFDLLFPRVRVEAIACVVWSDSAAQAGVEFLDTSATMRRRLKDWIFTRTLAAAHENMRGLIFAGPGANQEICQLTFSENPRPAIVLKPDPKVIARKPQTTAPPEESLPKSSSGAFAIAWWFIDGLIVISAILLFSVISLAMTRSTPSWLLAIMMLLFVAGIFTALYWFMFVVWTGATFGERLIRLEGSARGLLQDDEDRPRFR